MPVDVKVTVVPAPLQMFVGLAVAVKVGFGFTTKFTVLVFLQPVAFAPVKV